MKYVQREIIKTDAELFICIKYKKIFHSHYIGCPKYSAGGYNHAAGTIFVRRGTLLLALPVLPLSPHARFLRFSKGPVTSRLLGRSKYLNLTPRSLGQEKGTCSFGTGRFVITYPMLRPPGPARRYNQNE